MTELRSKRDSRSRGRARQVSSQITMMQVSGFMDTFSILYLGSVLLFLPIESRSCLALPRQKNSGKKPLSFHRPEQRVISALSGNIVTVIIRPRWHSCMHWECRR